jgi:hypothetical protein
MAASAILLVDVAYDSPATLELSRRHPYAPALLDSKMQGMDSVGLYGHLTLRHGSLAVRTGALQGVFLFCQARRGHASAQPGEWRASNVRPSGVG